MAESFEKPKKFTGEWVRHIWHYYKVHILCIAAVIVLGAITVMEILSTVHYDMNINYIATNTIASETAQRLTDAAAAYVSDADGDNEKHVSLTQLNYTPEAMQNGNQIMALENKLMSVFASPDEMMFLFDEMMLRDVLSMDAAEGVFIPVEQWCTEKVPEELLYMHNGEACGVKLSESEILKNMGIDASDMFVAVRMNYTPDDKKLNKILENCVSLANALVK